MTLGRSDIGLPGGHLTLAGRPVGKWDPFQKNLFFSSSRGLPSPRTRQSSLPPLAYVVVVAKEITDATACAPKMSEMGPCEPAQQSIPANRDNWYSICTTNERELRRYYY